MSYVFSWRSPETYMAIQRRKWWRFWAHDTQVERRTDTRYVVYLTEYEGNRLQRLLETDAPLLRKLMARGSAYNAYALQLELVTNTADHCPSQYIATNAS